MWLLRSQMDKRDSQFLLASTKGTYMLRRLRCYSLYLSKVSISASPASLLIGLTMCCCLCSGSFGRSGCFRDASGPGPNLFGTRQSRIAIVANNACGCTAVATTPQLSRPRDHRYVYVTVSSFRSETIQECIGHDTSNRTAGYWPSCKNAKGWLFHSGAYAHSLDVRWDGCMHGQPELWF